MHVEVTKQEIDMGFDMHKELLSRWGGSRKRQKFESTGGTTRLEVDQNTSSLSTSL
jgi:hypothetical protein